MTSQSTGANRTAHSIKRADQDSQKSTSGLILVMRTPVVQTSATPQERMLQNIDPAVKRELSVNVVRGIRSELTSRVMRREYERAARKMKSRGLT